MSASDWTVDQEACINNDCQEAWSKAIEAATAATRELASTVSALNLYQAFPLAISACQEIKSAGASPPECGMLSIQHWTSTGVTNAWAWLAAASEARRHGDMSGYSSAMHQASIATDWSRMHVKAINIIVANLPANTNSLAFLDMMPTISRMRSAGSFPLSALAGYCDTKQDGNKNQVCQRMAQRLLETARDLFELRIAETVAKRSGIAPETIAPAARSTDEVLTRNLRAFHESSKDPIAFCEYMNKSANTTLRSIVLGELALLREGVKD